MKAVQFARFDGPDALEVVDVPKPDPDDDQVLVRIKAIGVNYFETLMLRNRYAVTPELPMVPGVEVAGEVEAVGKNVRSPLVGARVAAPMFAAGRGSGGYAEYLAIEAASLVPVPDALSYESAVALMVQGLTALHLVRRSRPEGKSVLVNAAAGGVGSLLVQLAKAAGARRVIAAASTPEKLALARRLGADAGIDYSRADWTDGVRAANDGDGVDVVYDMTGGRHTAASLAPLAPLGELMFGALGRFGLSPAETEGMFAKNQSLTGFALLPLVPPASLDRDLGYLFQRAAAGALEVPEGRCYPLGKAAEAHKALESRQTMGKVVLKPGQ